MTKKLYQIINIKDSDNFEIQFGAIDRLNPEIVFIKCKTYLSSNIDDDHYYNVKNIFKKVKKKLQNDIRRSFFDNDFIFNYDITQDLNAAFQNKILTFDVFIKQTDSINKLTLLKQALSDLTIPLLNLLEVSLPMHNIFLSKTKQR